MRTTERITEVTIQQENGTQWVLVYYLQSISTREGDVYALRVDKLSRDGVLLEKAETYGLTDSKKEAMHMAMAFAKGTVPPCVLTEMADEYYQCNLAYTPPTQTVPVHTYRTAV
ncbi:MAG: DUF6514 family protein [Defluviitaleaceae bacterium]|nr:DUF6514 family protein [Defluviitaleaceae bacterium]MCL2273383.1 DUF6514 family protein [Defluviitaleaceae bacterium]